MIYTIKLNSILAIEKSKGLSDFLGGYIWSWNFYDFLPSTMRSNINRSRFQIRTIDCLNAIIGYEKDLHFYTKNTTRVSKIADVGETKKKYIKAWIIMGMFANMYLEQYGKHYFANTIPLIYNNNSFNNSIELSLENYIVNLCCIRKIYDNVNMEALGISLEEFNVVAEEIEKNNKKSIKCAQMIASNVEVALELRNYCEKHKNFKSKSEDEVDRHINVVNQFFVNIVKFMSEKGVDISEEDFIYLNFKENKEEPKREQYNVVGGNLEEFINVSELYSRIFVLHIEEKELQGQNPNPEDAKLKLVQNYRNKIENIQGEPSIKKSLWVASFLKNKNVKNAKKHMDSLSCNIELHRYKKGKVPEDLDINALCKLYSEIIAIYLQSENGEITKEISEEYKRLVVVNESLMLPED